MKQSALSWAEEDEDQPLDMDAPPDVLAVVADGKDRQLKNLQQLTSGGKRIFVCGLALDFCVLDTCLNAVAAKTEDTLSPPVRDQKIYMVFDAARAAHIPGVGQHGSGFLSEPSNVISQMDAASVGRTSVEAITGESPYGYVTTTPAFPRALGPLGLALARHLELDLSADTFRVKGGKGKHWAELERLSKGSSGRLSPRAKLPAHWPGAPPAAVELCWAYPLSGIAKEAFLAITTSPALMFAAYGGFLLLDKSGQVLAVQAISGGDGPEGDECAVSFSAPRQWRTEFTQQLQDAQRFQPVTLPFMRESGARHFCWIHPGEQIVLGSEKWTPSTEGAFLYLMASGESFYFPAMLQPGKERSSVRV